MWTASPASRTSALSPTHRMTPRPHDNAASALARPRSRFRAGHRGARSGRRWSAWLRHRAACAPRRAGVRALLRLMDVLRADRKAGHGADRALDQDRRQAQSDIDLRILRATPRRSPRSPSRSEASPCIFQLPATSFLRAIGRALAAPPAKRKRAALMRAGLTPKAPVSSTLSLDEMLSFFRRVSKSKIGTWRHGPHRNCASSPVSRRRHLQFRHRQARLRNEQLDARHGGRAGSHRPRDERCHAAAAPADRQQQNPNADYASIARDFDPLLDS